MAEELEQEPDFSAIIDFATEQNDDMMFHLKMILIAIKNKLWYNPETGELITEKEKDRRIISESQLKARIRNEYSTDVNNPVFGDVMLYNDKIRFKLVKLMEQVYDFSATLLMQLTLYSDNARVIYATDLFYQLSSSLIWSMCLVNDDFQIKVCSDRRLWELIWTKEFFTLIPAVYNLQRLYLELRDRTQAGHIVEFITDEPMTTLEVKGRTINLANRFLLIDGDLITIEYQAQGVAPPKPDNRSGSERVSRTFFLSQTDRGFDPIELKSNDLINLPEESDRIMKVKGLNYWQ